MDLKKEAVVAGSRVKLAEVLARSGELWPDGGDDASWGLVFISVVPTAGELAAIRDVASVCDRVVVARATPDRLVPPGLAKVVREAGGDILFVPSEVSGRLEARMGGEEASTQEVTLMLQALMTVLPSAVTVARSDIAVVRMLRAIQGSLGDFFTLRFA